MAGISSKPDRIERLLENGPRPADWCQCMLENYDDDFIDEYINKPNESLYSLMKEAQFEPNPNFFGRFVTRKVYDGRNKPIDYTCLIFDEEPDETTITKEFKYQGKTIITESKCA